MNARNPGENLSFILFPPPRDGVWALKNLGKINRQMMITIRMRISLILAKEKPLCVDYKNHNISEFLSFVNRLPPSG